MASHVLEEVPVGIGILGLVGHENPRQNWVLRNIVIIPACNLVEPLEILIVGHEFVDPKDWLARVHIVRKGILFDLDVLFHDGQEGVHIPEVEMEEHFLAVLGLDVDGVVIGIESLLVDLPDIAQGNVEIVEYLILERLYAHMIEFCVSMG